MIVFDIVSSKSVFEIKMYEFITVYITTGKVLGKLSYSYSLVLHAIKFSYYRHDISKNDFFDL